jgi:hypothetical protein
MSDYGDITLTLCAIGPTKLAIRDTFPESRLRHAHYCELHSQSEIPNLPHATNPLNWKRPRPMKTGKRHTKNAISLKSPRSSKGLSLSTNVRNYPEMMSSYERESLAAEAQLAAARKRRKQPIGHDHPEGKDMPGRGTELSACPVIDRASVRQTR